MACGHPHTLAQRLAVIGSYAIATTMKTPIDIYRSMKHKAKRLLLKGDLERYMRTLRTLHEMQAVHLRPQA